MKSTPLPIISGKSVKDAAGNAKSVDTRSKLQLIDSGGASRLFCQKKSFHCFLWPPCVADADIIFLCCFFFFSSPNLSGRRWDVYHTSKFYTWCVPSANLECKSEMCCTRLAANAGRKQSLKNRHLGTNAQLCRAISSQLNTNISSRCPHNMVNFGPLAAEVVSLVWGTPANFNGFRVLAALLHGTLLVGVSQTLRR